VSARIADAARVAFPSLREALDHKFLARNSSHPIDVVLETAKIDWETFGEHFLPNQAISARLGAIHPTQFVEFKQQNLGSSLLNRFRELDFE